MAKVDLDLARGSRLLECGPVVLLTCQYRGKRNVMPCAWITTVSSDPPEVAVAIFPPNYSHDMIVKGGDFVVNIPPRPLAEQVQKAGSISGETADKFLAFGLTPYESKKVNSPRIAECIAHIECGVVQVIRTGDHDLIIGEAVAVSAEENAFDGQFWTLADESVTPIQHLGKNVYGMITQKFEV